MNSNTCLHAVSAVLGISCALNDVLYDVLFIYQIWSW
ncbi:hypothetical protein THOM_1899 [Trachipleistophora hominis]|uniref:Uncharacterized protein n=1 Tax=Trachipleistophora hominis TaxID=72359 RepID=L7JUN9_TRAHO|nr:hypothetical protein THOM_1899 [Trachipleistophora hominis]